MGNGLLRRIPWLADFAAPPGAKGSVRAGMMREAGGTFVLRMFQLGFGFLVAVLLSRTLGASDYGAYRYAIAWIELLAVPGMLGFHRLVMREVAAYHAGAAWGLLRGLVWRANQVVLVVSLAVAGIAAGVVWLLAPGDNALKRDALLLALLLLPLKTLTRLRQAAVQGLQRVVLSQLPEMLIAPVLFVALVLGAYLLLPDDDYSIRAVIPLQVVATAIAFGVGVVMLRALLPAPVRAAAPVYNTRGWLHSALPLLMVNGITVINIQATSIILGTLRASELVGIYAIANQGAALIQFVYMAANNTLAPAFARLHAQGETERLQRLVTQSARLILVFSLPIALGMIALGRVYLAIFGAEFKTGYTALLILVVGQVFNAATGSGGWLLTMTGEERAAAWGIGISASVNVVAALVMVPLWGLNGAALATAGAFMLQNVVLVWLIWRRLGVHATPLGRIAWPRRRV